MSTRPMSLRETLLSEFALVEFACDWRSLTPREYVGFALEFQMSRDWRDSPTQYPDGTRTQAYSDEVNALWVQVWNEEPASE